MAKMRMAPFATESDVDEALRLFQVSTLDAAMTGNLAGMNCFTMSVEGGVGRDGLEGRGLHLQQNVT